MNVNRISYNLDDRVAVAANGQGVGVATSGKTAQAKLSNGSGRVERGKVLDKERMAGRDREMTVGKIVFGQDRAIKILKGADAEREREERAEYRAACAFLRVLMNRKDLRPKAAQYFVELGLEVYVK